LSAQSTHDQKDFSTIASLASVAGQQLQEAGPQSQEAGHTFHILITVMLAPSKSITLPKLSGATSSGPTGAGTRPSSTLQQSAATDQPQATVYTPRFSSLC